MVTRTNLRIEALRFAIDTQGNSNKLQLAEEYLGFLEKDHDAPAPKVEAPTVEASTNPPQEPKTAQSGKRK